MKASDLIGFTTGVGPEGPQGPTGPEGPEGDRVLDFVGGRADLEAGLIRCIGVAEERFTEDRLRLLRALRFALRFDFEIELF